MMVVCRENHMCLGKLSLLSLIFRKKSLVGYVVCLIHGTYQRWQLSLHMFRGGNLQKLIVLSHQQVLAYYRQESNYNNVGGDV